MAAWQVDTQISRTYDLQVCVVCVIAYEKAHLIGKTVVRDWTEERPSWVYKACRIRLALSFAFGWVLPCPTKLERIGRLVEHPKPPLFPRRKAKKKLVKTGREILVRFTEIVIKRKSHNMSASDDQSEKEVRRNVYKVFQYGNDTSFPVFIFFSAHYVWKRSIWMTSISTRAGVNIR